MNDDPFPQVMILAGEPSGDVHGAALVRAMKDRAPDLKFSGIGGNAMAKAGVDLFFHIEGLSAMGITEVMAQFNTIKKAFTLFKTRLRKDKPGLLILIDYPGFNLRAARFAKEQTRCQVFYYITPKVWAWNQGRIKKIKKFVDHAALIFPFEEKLYKKYEVPSTYVGNPLMDQYPSVRVNNGPRENPETFTIGLLPGSRKAEINNLLGIMLESARRLHAAVPHTRFLVSAADAVPMERINAILALKNTDNLFSVVRGSPQTIFKQAHLIIAASGTVTLEAGLCGIPTIIVYKMAPISYKAAKLLVKVKYAGLANLIANEELMPELLQGDANPALITDTAISMLATLKEHARKLTKVRTLLGGPGAGRRAARIALDLLKEFK